MYPNELAGKSNNSIIVQITSFLFDMVTPSLPEKIFFPMVSRDFLAGLDLFGLRLRLLAEQTSLYEGPGVQILDFILPSLVHIKMFADEVCVILSPGVYNPIAS